MKVGEFCLSEKPHEYFKIIYLSFLLSTAEPAFYNHFELRRNMAIKVGLPDNKVFFFCNKMYSNQWFKRASVMIYLHLQFPVADSAAG